MDLWGHLIGRKEQTLICVDGAGWVTLPASTDVDRALERRAQREKWPLLHDSPTVGDTVTDAPTSTDGADGAHEFHALLLRRSRGILSTGPEVLDVDVCGATAATLSFAEAGHVLEQMRVADATATAARARARRDAAGHWQVEILIGASA